MRFYEPSRTAPILELEPLPRCPLLLLQLAPLRSALLQRGACPGKWDLINADDDQRSIDQARRVALPCRVVSLSSCPLSWTQQIDMHARYPRSYRIAGHYYYLPRGATYELVNCLPTIVYKQLQLLCVLPQCSTYVQVVHTSRPIIECIAVPASRLCLCLCARLCVCASAWISQGTI